MNSTAEVKPPLAVWKKVLFAVALAMGVAGVALYLVSLNTEETNTAQFEQQSNDGGNTFRPQSFGPEGTLKQQWAEREQSTPPSSTESTDIRLADWSTLLMKLGFSFVVGFSIGYAISGFLKVALFAGGVMFLMLFGLQYAGFIDVNWQGLGAAYEGFVAWLQPHISNFKDFINSQLPASGTATAGLLMSLKR